MKNKKRSYRSRDNKSSFTRRFTRSRAGNFFFLAFLICAGSFSLLPLVYSVISSFKPIEELLIFPPRFFVQRPTLSNYVALPDLVSGLRVPFLRYCCNSIFVACITTFLYVVSSTMAAFSLSKGTYPGRKVFFLVIQFALMFNTYTLSIPSYLIYSKLKIIDTFWVYILPYLASTMGVFLMKQYIEGYMPDTLMEAAKIDGAGYWRILWTIVMPIVKPMWLTLTLFGFRDGWSMAPGNMIFKEQLKTLPMITSQISAAGIARSGSTMAITVIMIIPPILIYMLTQSNVIQSMTSAGIKE